MNFEVQKKKKKNGNGFVLHGEKMATHVFVCKIFLE